MTLVDARPRSRRQRNGSCGGAPARRAGRRHNPRTIGRDVRTDRAACRSPRVISARLPGGALGLDRRVRPGGLAPRSARPGRRRPFHGAHHLQGHARPTHRPALISEAIEGVGGSFNAATDRESTVYWVARPAPRGRPGDGRHRRAHRPARPRRRDEIEQRARRSSSRRSARTSTTRPSTARCLFQHGDVRRRAAGPRDLRRRGGHPGPARSGHPRLLGATTYRPANTVVAVAGDLTHAEAVEPRGGGVRARQRRDPAVRAGARAARRAAHVCSGKRDTVAGAARASAVPALRRDHPDSWTLAVLNARPRRRHEQPAVPRRSARSAGWPTTSARASSSTPTPALLEVSAGVDPSELASQRSRRSSPSSPGCATSRSRRRSSARPRRYLVRRAGAPDGRDPPRGVVDRRAGGAPRSRPDARRGAGRDRGGRRRRRSSGWPRQLFRDDVLRLAAVAPGPLPARRSTSTSGCPDDDADDAPSTEPRVSEVRPRRVDLAPARRAPPARILALARTELETLRRAGRPRCRRDWSISPSVRWRTGDLPGAGEAALAALRLRPSTSRSP